MRFSGSTDKKHPVLDAPLNRIIYAGSALLKIFQSVLPLDRSMVIISMVNIAHDGYSGRGTAFASQEKKPESCSGHQLGTQKLFAQSSG